MGLLGLVGLLGLSVLGSGCCGCQVGLILGIFLLFDLIHKYFQMDILSLMIPKNLMIAKSPMV